MLIQEKTGLIVIDIQGKLARLVHDSDTLITNCETLIKGANLLNLPIIVLEQNPDKLGPTDDKLRAQLTQHTAISKFTFDACAAADFLEAINNTSWVDTWLVCGIEAHICVYQTVTQLQQLGIKVQLITDCIASRLPANKDLAVSKLVHQGIEISGLEMCLYELMKDCRAPAFKEILNLIK